VICSLNTERVYRPSAVARLCHLARSSVSKWVQQAHGDRSSTASFDDLVELHLLRDLIEQGITPRKAHAFVRVSRDIPGPRRFFVHGSSVYRDIGHLLDLSDGKQLALRAVLEERAACIDYDADGVATQLWPLGKSVPVRIAPDIGFGVPTLVGTSTRTSVLADYVKAEGGNVAKVAAWFELPLAGVQAAVDFERSIAA